MNKEELFMSECRFFTRLDIRIATLSNLFQNMENVMLATAGAKDEIKKDIAKFHEEAIAIMIENDRKTNDFYSNLMEGNDNEKT